MSHFAEMAVQFDQKHEDALVAALESQFGKGSVEVHAEPAAVMTYRGADASQMTRASGMWAPPCHLIVRREALSRQPDYSTSNDAGYLRTEDGKYKAFIDDAGFSRRLQGLVNQEYAAIVSQKELRAKGYTVQRKQLDNGRLQLVATKY